jgi:hypothetical protein
MGALRSADTDGNQAFVHPADVSFSNSFLGTDGNIRRPASAVVRTTAAPRRARDFDPRKSDQTIVSHMAAYYYVLQPADRLVGQLPRSRHGSSNSAND